MRTRVVGWAAALVLAGCGDDGTVGGDGGVDATVDAGGDGGVTIAPPAAPVLTPCPAGFVEVGDPPRCDPFGGAPRQRCEAHEAHFPSEAGCTPIGGACPTGAWAEDLPATDVRFVQAGAAAGGDGSMGAPFATLTEALAGAPSGTVVAVAKGTYDETIYVPNGVTVWGACAAETRLMTDTTSLAGEGIITVGGSGGVVRGLSLSGARDGIVIREGADLTLEGVAIDAPTRAAITVFPDASVTGEDVVVRDVIVGDDGRLGGGLVLAPGASATMTRFAAIGCTSAAVGAYESTVVLEDAVLADGRAQPADGNAGFGLDAFAGSDVTIRRSVIEGNTNRAMQVFEPDTIVRFEDSVIRDTAPRERDGREGRGAFVYEGATLELRRVWLAGHREVALLVNDDESRLDAEDVVIEGTEGTEAEGFGGSAVALQVGASASLRRVHAEGNRGIAVVAFGGSALSLEDVTIRDTESEAADGRFGVGLHAQSGSAIDGAQVVIDASRQAGISAGADGASITLVDVRVTGTRERACAGDTCAGLGIGDGVISTDGASIALDGFEIRDSARAGALVAADGTMDLSRGRITANPIGAIVQTAGFDVARISEGVVYQDNGRNLDMSSVPVPEPPTGF